MTGLDPEQMKRMKHDIKRIEELGGSLKTKREVLEK
jgi:hypothetical protein